MIEAQRTFAEHVVDYAQAGWPCILPVPPETKTPPPVGFTGAEGRDTDPLTLVEFASRYPEHSIALRMPAGVIGIDVDQYLKGDVQKHGAETLAHHEAQWGPLPPTWTSTAREADGPSRIHFFRVPPQRYATKLTGTATGDVEIIQRHHRYAVVWPSVHHDAQSHYRWYDPAGNVTEAPPKPADLPELPPAWVEGLAAGATEQGPAAADRGSGERLLTQLLEDWRPECADITSARLQAVDELSRADAGSRHDTMTARVHHLVQLAAGGHTGVAYAVTELRETWASLTAGEERGEELERMLLTSARKAVTAVGAVQVPRDPCLFMLPMTVAAPTPGDDRTPDPEHQPLESIEPARWWSVREFIGVEAFDPNAGLDQTLAEAVLARMSSTLRYAYDVRSWLIRTPDQWEVRKDLGLWAIAQLAPLMPLGDPTAEKGSEPFERHQRRARFNTHAGSKAIAGKLDALVSGGTHPASVRLATLDSDPEILWAGGIPWSLRFSDVRPVPATHVDPSTPHLHSTGVLPDLRPTPLWDAFLAAVWPDPEVRRWAVRVLSVALTGYADRALPILLGETGRGKTQVVSLLMSVLGSYAHAADPRLMSERGEGAHASIVFALKGRRLSFIDEGPREGRWAQERLKQLTGGGELTANQMRMDPISFRPSHTLLLTTNDEPPLTDPAVRARTRLIPCDGDPELVSRTRAAIGPTSGSTWRAEAPGVLASMMAEAAGWLAEPSTASTGAAPEHIRYLAENFGAEQDPVSMWLTEETEPAPEGTPSRELYQAFVASCRRNTMRLDTIPSETKWGRTLTRLGVPAQHTAQGKRRPIRLRTGGFLPGMGPAPQVTVRHVDDGSGPKSDGFVHGSGPNPSSTFAQVNPPVSEVSDGLTGSDSPIHLAHAHTCAQEPIPESTANPTLEQGETAPDLREHGDELPPGEPVTPKPARKRAAPDPEKVAAAAAKRAAAQRELAIAAAAGATVALPAVVLRDGTVRSCSTADADALLATVTSAPGSELTVDVENTGYPIGHDDFALRTVQLGNEHFAVVLDPDQHDQADVVRRHLAAAAVLHAHSATADLIPLAVTGLIDLESAWDRMHDTAILAKLSDPASTGNDADLKNLSKAVLGKAALSPAADEARAALFKAGGWLTETEVTTPLERSGWAQVDPRAETMVRYAASDVLDDAALARLLPAPPPEVLERERATQRITARMAHTGFRFDPEQIDRLTAEHRAAQAEHAEHVRAFGIENPGSNDQLGRAFGGLGVQLPRTKTGKASVAAGVLEPMRNLQGPAGDLARAVLDYRHHSTALGLLLEPWGDMVRRGDGRARSTIYTLGADTGRMSSVRFNFQQVSREGGLRGCITADPGHLLVSADFAGVELRVACALSGDRNLRAIMGDPERDLHWEVARLAFGPDATKAQRYAVKRGVFGRIYGGGVAAVAAGVGVSHPVAQQVIDAMDAMTPELTEWSRMVRQGIEAGRTQFPTAAGRTIHLPVQAPHAGPNYCIQGTARELLVDALLRWSRTRWGDAVLLPVHDEIVVMVPEDEAEAATAALVEVMTTELAGVPIIAEASAPSFSWSDSA